jgi:hypothetical protein
LGGKLTVKGKSEDRGTQRFRDDEDKNEEEEEFDDQED